MAGDVDLTRVPGLLFVAGYLPSILAPSPRENRKESGHQF